MLAELRKGTKDEFPVAVGDDTVAVEGATADPLTLEVGRLTGCAVGVRVVFPTTIKGGDAEAAAMVELAGGAAIDD